MTKQELIALIRENCGPIVAEVVAEQVKAQVEAAQSAQAPEWATKLFQGAPRGAERVVPLDEKGLAFAKCIRATAASKLAQAGPNGAIEILKKWGSPDLAEKWEDARTKALAAGDATAGGYLVPTQFSQEIIEFLRAQSVVRKLRARTLPVPTGTTKIPKLTGGATAYYVGENANATKSEQTTGQLALTFKKLVTLVPMSNDLLRYSSPGADTIVRDDTVNAMRQREDQAFIRDDGTSSGPKGLRYWAHADNIIAARSSVTLQNVFNDLGDMILKLLEANIPMLAPGWIMAPRTETFLKTVLNSNGYAVFLEEMATKGTLWGWPYGVTTNVPVNVGAGSTKSELYLADFAQAVIGESMNLMVDSSGDAAYHDGSQVIAAFSQDQTVVRAIAEHDFGMRHDKAVAVLTEVSWKPGSI